MPMPSAPWPGDLSNARRRCLLKAGAGLGAGLVMPAMAQFVQLPEPTELDGMPTSAARTTAQYRHDLCRHIYRCYPGRIYPGRLPPLLHAVMSTEVLIGPDGRVRELEVLRLPASAAEVVAWVLALIERAAPFPAPTHLSLDQARWRETWLVDKSGRFQVHALSEGQR